MSDTIATDKAPAAIGPYAQARVADLTQFKAVNEVYAGFFQAPFPARSTVEVSALPLGASVEIDAVIAL